MKLGAFSKSLHARVPLHLNLVYQVSETVAAKVGEPEDVANHHSASYISTRKLLKISFIKVLFKFYHIRHQYQPRMTNVQKKTNSNFTAEKFHINYSVYCEFPG